MALKTFENWNDKSDMRQLIKFYQNFNYVVCLPKVIIAIHPQAFLVQYCGNYNATS